MATRGPYESRSPGGSPKTLAERIRAVRLQWGWTQGELGAALNTDQTAVSAWERAKAAPSGVALAALAGLFGTSPDSLETGLDFKPLPSPEAPPPARSGGPTVRLPDPQGIEAIVVDLEQKLDRPVDVQEAVMNLIQAARDGRRVWVVVE